MTAEFAALLALVLLNAQMCAEAIKHLNYLGCLAFGQQIDLQIEMVQSIGAAHESPRTTKLYDRTKERLTQDEVGADPALAGPRPCTHPCDIHIPSYQMVKDG